MSDFDFNEETNLGLEKGIRRLILFSCEKLLKNYSKKIIEDKILEFDNKNIYISNNQKIAIKKRKCEKKIIQRLAQNLQKDLK